MTAIPALRGLARAFPEHERLLAAPSALGPLLELADPPSGRPLVDSVVHTAGLERRLDRALTGADVAVNLHGRGPQSHRLLESARPRRLIAFRDPGGGATGPVWRAREHEVSRWCRLLVHSGVPASPDELAIRPPPEARHPGLCRTVIHPGAARAARRWPPERFAAVARAERAAGRQPVVTGSAQEAALARAVAAAAGLGSDAVVAGRTSLRELAGLVAAADRVVCGDTGVAHLATALGTPSVVLFGPTSPREWGPPPNAARHRALWAGRTGDALGPVPDPGLLKITVDDVLGALDELPAHDSRRSHTDAGAGSHRHAGVA